MTISAVTNSMENSKQLEKLKKDKNNLSINFDTHRLFYVNLYGRNQHLYKSWKDCQINSTLWYYAEAVVISDHHIFYIVHIH